MTSYPLNQFPAHSRISIVGIPSMQNLRVDKITDCGVHVYGAEIGHTVLSGKSPAINCADDVFIIGESKRAVRGSLIGKMSDIKTPSDKFTTQQLADHNEIPYVYALKWVNEHCNEVGKAEKVVGQRGKAATMYSIKSS